MICLVCNANKELDQFYATSGKTCKVCHCNRVRKNRRHNPAVQEYDRARSALPHRRAKARVISDKWRGDFPERYKAVTAVGNAVRDGKLQRQPCAVCGASKTHGHHDDYSKPLEVTWLCARHHKLLHIELEPC